MNIVVCSDCVEVWREAVDWDIVAGRIIWDWCISPPVIPH